MSIHTPAKLWIGTSNIVLPGNKSTFPGPFQLKSRLNYYSTLFNSVELNNTFYKVPMSSTFGKWSGDVGHEFRFSIKFSKVVTHITDLDFNEADIEIFVKNAYFLRDKKGCILLQFPGKITLEYFNKVEQILQVLANSAYTNEWDKVIEFRNSSWHTGETYELLEEYNSSMVLHDFSKGKTEEPMKRSGVVYLRFHGPAGNYRGSYSYEFLKQKVVQIRAWLNEGKQVYAYFNNTAGDAYQNARTLKEIYETRETKQL